MARNSTSNTDYNDDDDHFSSTSFAAAYGGGGNAAPLSAGTGGGGNGSAAGSGGGQRKRVSFTTLTNSLSGGGVAGQSSSLSFYGSSGGGQSSSSFGLSASGTSGSGAMSSNTTTGGRSRTGMYTSYGQKNASDSDYLNTSDLDDSDGSGANYRPSFFSAMKNWKSTSSWTRKQQKREQQQQQQHHAQDDPSDMAAAAAAVAADDSMHTGNSSNHSSNRRSWTSYGGGDDNSERRSNQHNRRAYSRFSSAFGGIKPRASAAVFARSILHRRDTTNSGASGNRGSYGKTRSMFAGGGARGSTGGGGVGSVFGPRSVLGGGSVDGVSYDAAYAAGAVQAATYRRYKVGEPVLVEVTRESNFANLVNRWGYPSGRGNVPEEMRGPYKYSLATVIKVHFGENTVYYTVTRFDTGVEQRADAEWMEPVSRKGAAAARKAASTAEPRDSVTTSFLDSDNEDDNEGREGRGLCYLFIYCLCLPFFCARYFWHNARIPAYNLGVWIKYQGYLFLYGKKPYSCQFRITMVNVMVFCSIWYNFMDQARLAFLPPRWDLGCAYLSCIAWSILVLELFFEVFVRPDGYKSQIVSEKAFEPETVRYINRFHLIVESLSLIVFVPEFACLFSSADCHSRESFSFYNASLIAVVGPTWNKVFYGRAYLALIRLRVFGLVRHWKKMWINNTVLRKRWIVSGVFVPGKKQEKKSQVHNSVGKSSNASTVSKKADKKKNDKEEALANAANIGTALMITTSHRAMAIFFFIFGMYPLLFCFKKNGGANPIAPQMVNQLQHNNLVLNNEDDDTCEFFRTTVQNWATGIATGNTPRLHSKTDLYLLRLEVGPVRCSNEDMDLEASGGVVTAAMCDWIDTDTMCNPLTSEENMPADLSRMAESCCNWQLYNDFHNDGTQLSVQADVRRGAITIEEQVEFANMTFKNGTTAELEFKVVAHFNNTFSVEPAAFTSVLLQVCWILFLLAFLSMLRRDAGILVLDPLRRMLKFVAQYAKNPLTIIKFKEGNDAGTTIVSGGTKKINRGINAANSGNDGTTNDGDGDETTLKENELGSFETEQLITAVSKITDLLRKCWGVAGADIISTNLARQEGSLAEVFNPTVPGKSVYALFAFCAVDGFDRYLRSLEGDIMILINDVASVLHNEVFRWGFGDSGQCNKNLGSAWLMVFRIGNVKEVIKKLEEATHVVFSSSSRGKRTIGRQRSRTMAKRRGSSDSIGSVSSVSSIHSQGTSRSITTSEHSRSKRKLNRNKSVKAMNLSLKSLPGISNFTDRALIGMLKTFAGIYRDNKLLSWKNDFRLGCGVGVASPLNMIFGMDAGWAVEGAVGSEYKIDATYLSPHVNMASRMMSACKQYGVSILLSEAVHELISVVCQKKLRHLDTVTVKGSSVRQRIYTYDARHKGVDFFLFQRSDEQADEDSDQYTPSIWSTDQDLTAMRQHITDDFLEEFDKGRDEYLAGDWPSAIKHLEAANQIMTENVVEQGYIEDELAELHSRILDGEDAQLAEQELRNETEDGPSCRLLTYMKSEGSVPPSSWKGYRPLMSK